MPLSTEITCQFQQGPAFPLHLVLSQNDLNYLDPMPSAMDICVSNQTGKFKFDMPLNGLPWESAQRSINSSLCDQLRKGLANS